MGRAGFIDPAPRAGLAPAQESRVLKFSICRPVDIEGSFEAHAARGGVLVQSIKTQFFVPTRQHRAGAPHLRRGAA